MSAARVVLSVHVAACAFVAACGSFDAAPDPSLGADAAPSSDASTASDGGAPLDALQPACTAQVVTDGFTDGFPGWDTSQATGLSFDTTIKRSDPGSLFLELSPSVTTERFIARELPGCHVSISLWFYVKDAFGDGEVDFVTVSDALTKGAPGLHLVGAKAYPNALSVEDPSGQRKTAATLDTWIEVKMDVDPTQHVYTMTVAGEPFTGTLPDALGASGHLYLLLGATWVESGRTKPWKVYYDDVTLKIVP